MKMIFKAFRSQVFEINCFAILMYLIFYLAYPLLNDGYYALYRIFYANPMSLDDFSNQYGDLVMIGIVSLQIICVFIYQRIKKIKFEPFHLKEKWHGRLIIVAFLCILSFNFLTDIISTGLEGIVNQAGYTLAPPEVDLPQLGRLGQFFSVFYTVIAGPVAEEVVYRGVVARQGMKISPVFGIVLSSLIFSGMHANIDQTIATFVIGLILGLTYYATGSLMIPICLHILNNLSVTLMNYWPIDQWLPTFSGVWNVFTELMFYFFFLILGLIAFSRMNTYLAIDYQFKWHQLIEVQPIDSINTVQKVSLISYLFMYATLISTYLLFGLYWVDTLAALTPLK